MAKADKEKSKTPVSVADYHALVKPVITEKSSLVGGDGSCVVFKVAKKASKDDIKRAIEGIFNVEVTAVNTANFMGKLKRTNRSVGHRAGYKKAYVTLKQGQTIDIVEGL